MMISDGRTFSISVDTENNSDRLLIYNIYDSYKNFDVSHETYSWLDENGHGKNGAPYDMMNVYKEFSYAKELILELHDELSLID